MTQPTFSASAEPLVAELRAACADCRGGEILIPEPLRHLLTGTELVEDRGAP